MLGQHAEAQLSAQLPVELDVTLIDHVRAGVLVAALCEDGKLRFARGFGAELDAL